MSLGTTGGVPEVDRCDGTFTEMSSYETTARAIPCCPGVGQYMQVEGDDRVYEAVDIRDTPKTWATTDDLRGLGGDFALIRNG